MFHLENAEKKDITSLFHQMKLITIFYLSLLIYFFMQNMFFNELNIIQKIVVTYAQDNSTSSQELCIAFTQINVPLLSGVA